MAGSGTLLATLLYLPSYPLILAAVGLVSVVAQMYRPASVSLLAQLTPKNRMVMTMAMYRFGLNLGTTAAPMVGFALYGIVYVQYMSTLPLDIRARGVAIFWYTAAVSMNGFLVIAFELLVTKLSQNWPMKLTVGASFALVGIGVAVYGLPLGPAVIMSGTLIWTIAEIVGGPASFSYPAIAGPAHLKARYVASFQFMFGLGVATGPVLGSLLFARVGHLVWPLLALGALAATVLGVAGIRTARQITDQPAAEPPHSPAREPAGAGQEDR